jgi:hypothetical protein
MLLFDLEASGAIVATADDTLAAPTAVVDGRRVLARRLAGETAITSGAIARPERRFANTALTVFRTRQEHPPNATKQRISKFER